ncbi:triple tyrosine motif-containing protein [Pinibacter soli]|uniref:Triple tyrosine motif-containing protein n=1 Tax=Pinibacter soli TaxID=3044211 RepID=A0ABT6RAA5_9BACT|nr:triple tyrosine motif-containing protein [Pinibacter soli]MDI3319411.1 triple tyrosine motif-containing protein [Pinibacter soli]
MRKILTTILLLLFATIINAQNQVGLPSISNFSRQVYEAGKQTRCIGQDRRGIMYFANDDGLLVYDGTYWNTYQLPNKSIVRSLMIDNDRIYVGGQQEFGYFYFDSNNALVYHSFKDIIPPKENEFTDVWNVIKWGDDIFFRSAKRIFWLHGNTIKAYESINWGFLGVTRNLLVAEQFETGLVYFSNGKWIPLPNGDDFKGHNTVVKAITDFTGDMSLITTLKNGLYTIRDKDIEKFKSPDVTAISQDNLYSACVLDGNLTAIATNLNGLYIIDSQGKVVQHLTKKHGLQKNNIMYVFADRNKNLWLGLDNGIDLIAHDNAIAHINPDNENKSPGYAAIVYKNNLYLGTASGVYRAPLQNADQLNQTAAQFNIIEKSQGQVWGMNIVNDHLLISHNEGAYIVNGNAASPLDETTGFWLFRPLGSQTPAPLMLAGTYNGINLYSYENGQFVNKKQHTHFESAKFVAIEGNNIWAAHPYKGLYRIYFDTAGVLQNKLYNDKNKILSENHNHVFNVQGKIVLTTGKGIFEFDPAINDFKRSDFFTKIFGNASVSYLKDDAHGNIWFIQDKKPGVIDCSDPHQPKIVFIPELNSVIMSNGEEFIYPYNNSNVLIGSEEGFYNVDYEKYKNNKRSVSVLLRKITASSKTDSVLFGGYLSLKDTTSSVETVKFSRSISYKYNSVQFEFSSPIFVQQADYSCRLKGFESEWSPWSKKAEKSYTNLPAGDYTFEVKAKDDLGNVSPVSTFSFTVLPPWYRTIVAYLVYLLLFAYIIYWFYKRQQKKYLLNQKIKLQKQQEKYEAEQERLQFEHQRVVEKNEREIIQLRNEKLEAEVAHKNTELASNTMTLLQKREVLNKIKEELVPLRELDSEKEAKTVRKIIKLINDQLETDDDWDRFANYFDKVNNDFLKTLKDKFPQLTATDLKLCAYLRINLSSKEIANLLNISIRGVETSRYRLRKKLDLPNETGLFDFLAMVGE